EAAEKGAIAALVQKQEIGKVPAGFGLLGVADTQKALQQMARGYRRMLPVRVVSVTGSSGKSSTKEMLAAVLGTMGQTHRTPGNLNNHFGVPLTLMGIGAEDMWAVVELAMNAPGEIGPLAELAEPEAGLVTNIGWAHVEGTGSREATAREKGALYRALPASGLAISKDYVMWQTRGAYDHGVIEHLRVDHPIMKQPVIFFVGWNNFFFREVYRHYEWERMMEGATGTRGRRVIMAQPPLTQAIWDEKIQQDLWPGESLKVSPQSCQMIFQPIATPENIRWGAGLEYLWKKYTLTPEMLANWAKSRVTIQMNVVANCDAVINPEPLRTPDEQHRKKLSR
ncbi:MAG: hypothetical protein EBV03_01105, partial [Proteobacteria bacterium]|nr:hypothetical protein [Pseudomonadota bacterium]